MRHDCEQILNDLIDRLPVLNPIRDRIAQAADMLIDTYSRGGKVLICGNGGSAADSEHIAGELLKGFLLRRPLTTQLKDDLAVRLAERGLKLSDDVLLRLQMGLPAVSLVSQVAIGSAIANDLGADLVYAQQTLALGRPGDLLIGLSTSGNAQNVIQAVLVAGGLGMKTLGMTGANGGLLAQMADVCLKMPADATPLIQELHLPVYHVLCAIVEQAFFAEA
jgi:D-sedoheptulose 7-phosphate isomerase